MVSEEHKLCIFFPHLLCLQYSVCIVTALSVNVFGNPLSHKIANEQNKHNLEEFQRKKKKTFGADWAKVYFLVIGPAVSRCCYSLQLPAVGCNRLVQGQR